MDASLVPPQVSQFCESHLGVSGTVKFSHRYSRVDRKSGSSVLCKFSVGGKQSNRTDHGRLEKLPAFLQPADSQAMSSPSPSFGMQAASLPQRASGAFKLASEASTRGHTWPASQLLDTQSQRDVSARAQTDRQSRRARYGPPTSAPRDVRGPRSDPASNDSQSSRGYDSEYIEDARGGWERGGRGGGGGGWDYNEGGEEDEEKPGGEIVWRGVNKFVLAGVFTIGIGAGVAFTSVVNLGPTNVASRDVIDQKTPNPDVCLANGMSAMVLDQRLFISFNPFNVYVSQAEVKPGCVLRQSNWQVLESRGLVNKDEVRDCKRNMNTFGFVGDLRQAPEISCVYHSETAENQFLKDPAKAALGDGFQPKDFTE